MQSAYIACCLVSLFIDRESGELWVKLLKSKDEWVSEASRVLNQLEIVGFTPLLLFTAHKGILFAGIIIAAC